MNPNFWRNKKVLITGHTGFKGAWMSLWLSSLGARVIGYALDPPTNPSLFESAGVQNEIESVIGDIRDQETLRKTIARYQPEIVFHMAAQSLVLRGYETPVETFDVNVLGTATVLEILRQVNCATVLVVVTTDKCYQVGENPIPFVETDTLGGSDPYSSSKACAEILVSAYRSSYWNNPSSNGTSVATARAGNVIGGGDWATDRLIPDMVRATLQGKPVVIRNPLAVRPWQHVLEPLGGYLLLAEKLWDKGARFAEAWNFGPAGDSASVEDVVDQVIQLWGDGPTWVQDEKHFPHETKVLKLDCSKAMKRLGWKPRWKLSEALEETVRWYKAYVRGEDVRDITLEQLEVYQGLIAETPK